MPAHVFVLDLDDLAQGDLSLDSARPVAWRFMTPGRQEPVAIDVSERDLDVQIERSPAVQDTIDVLRELHEQPGWEDATARVLRIPEAHVTALWVSASESGEDVVVPVGPAPKELQTNHRYAMPEFLGAASSLARDWLAAYSELDASPTELGS
jgi:hypothetical protein